MIAVTEFIYLIIYFAMFGALVLLAGTYWLVWRIRKSKHVLALTLFFTSIVVAVMFMLFRAINRAMGINELTIADNDFFYAMRILFVLISTCFLIYTSWEQENKCKGEK